MRRAEGTEPIESEVVSISSSNSVGVPNKTFPARIAPPPPRAFVAGGFVV